MAVNVEHLIVGLEEYNGSLNSHLSNLVSDFNSLKEFYHRLASEYEGEAANAFKAAWGITSEWFEEYLRDSQDLSKFLEERIESLKKQGES